MSINGTLDIAEDCSLYGAGEYIEKMRLSFYNKLTEK